MADRAVRRRDLPKEFHATAPVRLDFAGGWTDVPPFSAREGGIVVNASGNFTTSTLPNFIAAPPRVSTQNFLCASILVTFRW